LEGLPARLQRAAVLTIAADLLLEEGGVVDALPRAAGGAVHVLRAGAASLLAQLLAGRLVERDEAGVERDGGDDLVDRLAGHARSKRPVGPGGRRAQEQQ